MENSTKQSKQWLSPDGKVWTSKFVVIRVDKRKCDLTANKPFERWDPQFWNPAHQDILDTLKANFKTKPLGDFIKFMTYGQVGKRRYSKNGKVYYIQTINITDTGIDYHTKLAHLEEGSWNDLERSRLRKYDVLLGNSGMGGMGKVAIFLDEDKMVNISQDIDLLRIRKINPFFVAAFLKSRYGKIQVWYHAKGVGAPKIPFDEVKSILIPIPSDKIQKRIEEMYKEMAQYHYRAMELKQKADPSFRSILQMAKNHLNDINSYIEDIIQGKRES